LAAVVHLRGGWITEIPVSTQARFAGESHYGLSRTVDVFLDIAHFWFQTAGKGRPLYLFGRLSLSLLAVTALLVFGLVIVLATDLSNAAWPLALLATTTGLSSLGLLATGVSLESLIETHDVYEHEDAAEPALSIESLRRAA
jgi:hypothetical protein